MASTQIEIALADDDRRRLDRICQLMEGNSEMHRKHANQASFLKEFHGCLNGIDEIRCIPGAAIDDCWDAKAIREVVMVLVANCARTWKNDWRGSEKGISENARSHNEACDSERKRCEHRIVEDDCGSAICINCSKDFGWYCQISTKHFCEYTDDECCIHCGAPEERQ